ncbi:hypothetical protein ACSRUE_21140 [Sorangium sp. KYC3313]|uniref:hypothetical protein n=1 Tax=Sorangium sp. KYC3313 TaxID=3449740 RepID=UPI003F8C854A
MRSTASAGSALPSPYVSPRVIVQIVVSAQASHASPSTAARSASVRGSSPEVGGSSSACTLKGVEREANGDFMLRSVDARQPAMMATK